MVAAAPTTAEGLTLIIITARASITVIPTAIITTIQEAGIIITMDTPPIVDKIQTTGIPGMLPDIQAHQAITVRNGGALAVIGVPASVFRADTGEPALFLCDAVKILFTAEEQLFAGNSG